MTLGETIYNNIEKNEYLNELYTKILYNYSLKLLNINEHHQEFDLEDILQFADILSKSNHPQNAERHKTWGQEIISILKQLYPDNEVVDAYLNSVLSSSGNFPGIDLLNNNFPNNSFLNNLYTEYSKHLLTIPADNTKHFFKSQKKIYEHLEDPTLSFSGPTSIGKSFIMRMFIKQKLTQNYKQNFAIIVPSKALINEVSSNFINELQDLLIQKNYRIVTSAGAIALEQNHNYIFVLTPERLLYTLIKYPDLLIDYAFIDEAHKISEKDVRSTFYYKIVDMLIQKANHPKIIFASPNIPNPEVFLKLTSKNEANSISTAYSPVNQLKYMFDYVENQYYICNDKTQKFISISNNLKLSELLSKFFIDNSLTIVYVNAKDKAITMAKKFASTLPNIEDKELKAFSKEIKASIHEDYFLAELVLKGVAFHIGYLPSNIRQKLESLYRDRKIKLLFCTSTLVEGVNLPADNLFITSYKRGSRNFSQVDFKNLIGRVGRIGYNLYGHVFFVRMDGNLSRNTYTNMIIEDVPNQQLSIVSELDFEDKKYIVDNLLVGNIEFSNEQFKSKNDIIRKFALILLRDIMRDRHSMVRKYFSDVLNAEEENQIKEIFSKQEAQPDDDINTSVDQTNLLIKAIKTGLKYPSLNNDERADYNEVLDFLNKLNKIFKWEIYEEDLSNQNQLRWYATLLCQWIEGKGLQNLTNSAISNARDRIFTSHPKKVRVNGNYEQYNNTTLHKNLVIGETLQAIERVILFSFANYFLKFSEWYKKIHNLKDMQNDWYEYVEYGTTNPLSIMLQKYGFSRETALYIKQNHTEYVKYVNNEVKLKKTILENTKESIKNEIQEVMYNAPELFID